MAAILLNTCFRVRVSLAGTALIRGRGKEQITMVTKREKANYTIQSVSHALDILESKAGTQFDPELTLEFKRMVEDASD